MYYTYFFKIYKELQNITQQISLFLVKNKLFRKNI